MKSFGYSKKTDEKWQKKWRETGLYQFDESKISDKLYLLEMFSYPSGKNLHIGHWWNYGLSDIYGRFKRMRGYEVFHPPGFDSFGLPAENYAIKTGVHPYDSTKTNIATMEAQFRAMGTTYDWAYEIDTSDEGYYKWTQWLFLKLFEKGLAYRKEAPVNWCPSCLTVLANEQAAGGNCERCGSAVSRRDMTQWFFRITAYAEELLSGLDALDWPEKTKRIQSNWIGKSAGAEIDFDAGGEAVTVFTTRPETLMGVTYLVLAPEHPAVNKLTATARAEAVRKYRDDTAGQSELERMSAVREKTGVFTGSYAAHPVTGAPLPIWIADYVLTSYGTGAVMAVPAHDERDFEFAVKFGLPVIPVIRGDAAAAPPYCGDGLLINSGPYTGLPSEKARLRITGDLERAGRGRQAVKYRLRDWLVSRQRYWGAPIPVIHCARCGVVPVPEAGLPVRLPYGVEFRPGGQSPLAACGPFVSAPCPRCGRPARRDTDTLDTFVCSSWYYLRFFDNKNADAPFDKDRAARIMPVDKYVGGVEHAAMHLLYARFVTKALRDMGYLGFDEPFPSLVHQGVITGSDGKKMSKRQGAVSPDVYVEQYGADVFRLYLAFGFSFHDGGQWNDGGIKAIARFVSRLGRLLDSFLLYKAGTADSAYAADGELDYIRHKTIRQVAADLEAFGFNTAVARLMEYAGALAGYQKSDKRSAGYEEAALKDLILLLAPLAPHLAEELWAHIGLPYSAHNQKFPDCDEGKLVRDMINVAVQVDGKLKDVITVPAGSDEEAVKAAALSSGKVRRSLGGRQIARLIYIEGRLVSIVCG